MTFVLAKIFGLYFLAMGIGFFFNPERLRSIYQQVLNDKNFLFLGGIIAILLGAFVISTHNQWVWGWPVIITILGWWSLIKGYALIIYPRSIELFSFIQNRSDTFYRIISLFYLVLGLFLLYMGWY
jgi:uncharacterized protein YjeT (DUF2065 family)